MKIYFITFLDSNRKGNGSHFAFRFGPRRGNWWEYLSVNGTEFRNNKINFIEVKSERLIKVYLNFCRRMKMKGTSNAV